VEVAVLRLEEHQDEIALSLEHLGLTESHLDEVLLIVSELAMEMYLQGRGSRSVNCSPN
jgi:hypothetical protein